MADNKVTTQFDGDASGVVKAGQTTEQVVTNVRRKLQDLQNPLQAMGRAWTNAFNVSTGARKAGDAVEGVGKKSRSAKSEVDGLSSSLKALGAGAGIAVVARQAQEMADSWTRSRNLLAAVGVEAQNLGATQNELVKIATETRTALEPTVFLYSRMYRAVKPLGIAQEEVARATEITNKAFKAGGAAVSEQNNAILQLSQALGSGLLQGDELRSVRENAPLVAQAIADEFDTTIAGLKKLGEQGELTTDRVFKGIVNGGKDIDAQFAVTIPTISDGFTNLQTALIAFIGKGNEASGVSLAIGAGLNFVAQNLDGLVKALVLGGTAWGVYSVATALAAKSTGGVAASMAVVAVRSAIATTATALASRSFYTMATAATAARYAISLMLGPIGLAIAAAAGLAALFGIMDSGADSTRNWGAEIASTRAKLGQLQAAADDLDDDRINRVGSAMQGMSDKTETAAERVERLAEALEAANLAAYEQKLMQAEEVITETQEQIEELGRLLQRANRWNIGGDLERQEIYNDAVAAGNQRIEEAIALKERLAGQGTEGQDMEAQKRLNDAIFSELEVRAFKVRDNAQQELQVLREKVQAAANIYGDESDEYMRAVKEREALSKRVAREAVTTERNKQRAIKDAQKDELEQFDLRLEAAQEDKDLSIQIMDEKLAKLKEFYGEESREYARGLQERLRMLEAFNRQATRAETQRIRATEQASEEALQGELFKHQNQLQQKLDLIDAAAEQGRINEVQALQLKQKIADQETSLEIAHQTLLFNIKVKAQRDFLALENLRPDERARALGEIEKLEIEHANTIARIQGTAATATMKNQGQVATAVQDSWAKIVDPIGQSFSTMFQDLYNGTAGWRESFLKVLDNILFSFVDMGIQMAAKWAAQQLAMTAASVLGGQARVAAKGTEAAATTSISAGEALGQIMNYAYTAAAGAFSALAGIPIVGPVLAVGASAAALAAVLGFAGKIFSAEGGFGKVPYDGAITELHKDEMVLPSEFATPLRSMLTGVSAPAGPGALSAQAASTFSSFQQSSSQSNQKGDTNFYYQPNNSGGGTQSGDLKQMLRRDGRALRKWFENETRNGTLKG